MIPLFSKESLQLLSIAKCQATIAGRKKYFRHLVLNLISHYFLTRLFNFQRSSSLVIAKWKAHLPPPPLPKK